MFFQGIVEITKITLIHVPHVPSHPLSFQFFSSKNNQATFNNFHIPSTTEYTSVCSTVLYHCVMSGSKTIHVCVPHTHAYDDGSCESCVNVVMNQYLSKNKPQLPHLIRHNHYIFVSSFDQSASIKIFH